MSVSLLSNHDVERAQLIWAEYQRQHDLSTRHGQTAGIDPASGKVWFGDSILVVTQNMEADGVNVPLYFVRVGQDHYYRKGSRRG